MKNFYKFLIIIGVALLCSCSEQTTPTFEDSVIGLNQETQLLFLRDGSGPVSSGITIQFIGAASSSPINYSITINDGSTAIEGVHYDISSTTGTIPAGAVNAELPIVVNPDNIEPGDVWTLILDLSSSDTGVAPFAQSTTYSLLATCPNTIPLDRTWTATILEGAFGAFSVNENVTITDGGDGTLFVSDITAGVLPSIGCCDAEEGAFINNICDQITIARVGPTASFGFETNTDAGFGPGSWNPDSQILTINWWEPGNGFGAIVELFPN
jgi:hypothetical protein